MPADFPVPTTADELREQIVKRHDTLSNRLRQIGRYVLDEPNDLALETLAVIAERCGVQPSAIVRFAKAFGFDGASQMQKLFRDGLLSTSAALGYSERVRQLDHATNAAGTEPADLLAEFVEGNRLAMGNLLQTVSAADMSAAVEAVVAADIVYVVGYRRSFPVASYLVYSLLQAGKRVTFIDGIAGLATRQARTMGEGDLLIAVSFQPYAEETIAIVGDVAAQGRAVLAITDSAISPIAQGAKHVLQVRESEVRGFRSLSASICLAQALVINFAFEMNRRGADQPKGKRAKK